MSMTLLSSNRKNINNFLEDINNVDPAIKFTVENNKQDGAIPFLDTTVKFQADNTLSLAIYRKPTHIDHYLQWDSHHHLAAKYSVISTLTHRARTVCTKTELLNQELQHLTEALTKYKYPKWALDKIGLLGTTRMGATWETTRMNKVGGNNDNNNGDTEGRDITKNRYTKGHIVIPYMQEIWDPDPLQGKQSHQEHTSQTQGKRPFGQKEWDHLLVSMWGACV